jgi:ATP-binding cassette, sub-family E, member 1
MARVAIIDKDKCHPEQCNWLCVGICPVNRTNKECIVKGKSAVIDEDLCTGCGICPKKCPYGAINIVNLPEELKEDPIHRFGQNAFRLFHLPIPKKGVVVGILGRNGIGKSTALEILSGKLIPNSGDFSKKGDYDSIIERFSTVALGDYFKKLKNDEIRVAYKPQRIEMIPKVFSGKVGELINRIDERNVGEELIKELGIEHLKERKLDELSGGELQKVAIIATAVKKADFYFFDEPASFADVTSRIKIAKLIRSLKEVGSVMVVEHDLATLDYISDEIQILYGVQGAFGIVSQSKGVRRGINEYLDGYLPDDNVRFRDYEINFKENENESVLSSEVLVDFDEMEKNFESFSLKTNKGSVHKGEVLTIMGANGLGKSTFLNLLSGKLKSDSGEVREYKISYKEQYPSREFEGNVRNELMAVAKAEFNSGWYKQNILEKLNLNKVVDNKIKELSGGELQKFHVALCLSREADIYALDEPSAFVDVEDRLKVAEVIKEFVIKKEKCAIVVDHDVQFADYLGDRMLVFLGEPAIKGFVEGPLSKREGMNKVLEMLDITYRKDIVSHRPRINKPGSNLDSEQRKKKEFYYN